MADIVWDNTQAWDSAEAWSSAITPTPTPTPTPGGSRSVPADPIDVTVWQHLSGATWADIGSIDTWESLSRETRHLDAGPWSLSVPLNSETVKFAAANAKQYLLTFAFRGEETTGVVEHVGPSQPEEGGITLDIEGRDAFALLGDALCWPVPTKTIDLQDTAYYTVTGRADVATAGIIAANLNRLYSGGLFQVTVPTPTLTAAGQTTFKQRFGNLLTTVAAKGETYNFGVKVGLVRQSPGSTRADLTVSFYQPQDRSGRIFLSQEVGTLRSWSQSDDIPTMTRAVTGGGGKGTQRTFVYPTRTAPESEWGRRREAFISDTSTTDVTELTTNANEQLDGAVAQSSFDLETVDAAGMRYLDHFAVGDSVTIELTLSDDPNDPDPATVSKVDRLNAAILTSGLDGVKVQLRPGNPDVAPLFKQAAIVRGLRRLVRDLQLQE